MPDMKYWRIYKDTEGKHVTILRPGVGHISCPTIRGYDEFARKLRLPYSRPQQGMWFTHPEHAITMQFKVYADEPRAFEQAPWVSRQAA